MRTINFAARALSKSRQSVLVALAAITLTIFAGSAVADDLLFDWQATQAPTPVTGYIPAPFVRNSTNLTNLSTQLSGMTPGKVTIKVTEPLNSGMVSSIFGSGNTAYKVNYAFYDLEGTNAAAFNGQVTAINTAAGVNKPVIGNYDLYPSTGDPTKAPGYTPFGYSAYVASGATMANESLYPGSWMFRTKTTGANSQSTAPNIRAALFTLPITRATIVEATLPAGSKHIPYVNRFNNYGNTLLNDAPTAQFPFRWSNPTGDQMLSRGDFKAMVLHYRLRGVDGIHLLDGGVEGYTQQQFEQDAKDGWNGGAAGNAFATIFAGGNAKFATLDTTVKVDGNIKSLENAGVVFSGVYSLTQDGGKGKLALLVSNLDGVDHTLSFPSKIGAKSILNSIPVAAGTHELLQFTGAGTQWQLSAAPSLIFNAAGETDRNGVGVPEPVAMGTLSLFAAMALLRRGRRH